MRGEPGRSKAFVVAVLTAIGAGVWACSDAPAKAGDATQANDAGTANDGRASPNAEAGADGGTLGTMSTVLGRPYATFVPSRYDTKSATPLVLQLHGYSWDAQRLDAWFKMTALAEQRTFLVATPNGTPDFIGNQSWNATDACCSIPGSPIDDSGYLAAVIANVRAQYTVDPKRIYVVGHSNGAFMAHRMACDHADVVAAIASFAGATFGDATKCAPAAPVAILQIHGTEDEMNAYSGGTYFPGFPPYPSAEQTIATWADKNGCAPTLEGQSEQLDLVSSIDGSETKVARHACTQGAAELWSIAAGTHTPSLQPTFAGVVYDFLAAHPRP